MHETVPSVATGHRARLSDLQPRTAWHAAQHSLTNFLKTLRNSYMHPFHFSSSAAVSVSVGGAAQDSSFSSRAEATLQGAPHREKGAPSPRLPARSAGKRQPVPRVALSCTLPPLGSVTVCVTSPRLRETALCSGAVNILKTKTNKNPFTWVICLRGEGTCSSSKGV